MGLHAEDHSADRSLTPAAPSEPSTHGTNVRRRVYTIVPTPERSWWHELPYSQPVSTKKVRGSRGNSMWCGRCKMRGFCSHMREHAHRLTLTEPGADLIPRASSAT